jgi:hypothetical protein
MKSLEKIRNLVLDYLWVFQDSRIFSGREMNILLTILDLQQQPGKATARRIQRRTKIPLNDIYRILKRFPFVEERKVDGRTVYSVNPKKFEKFLKNRGFFPPGYKFALEDFILDLSTLKENPSIDFGFEEFESPFLFL